MTTTRQFLITLIATIALHAALPSTATAQASGGPDLITPAEARAMKQQSGPAVVFIDVRSRVEAAMRGTAAGVDYVVPYRELAHPVRWDNARSALAMVPNPAFVSQVQAAVKAQGATTDTLILLLCGSGTRAGQAATELRQAGFLIAIDDFGTGYSSLSQLHEMNAVELKIDISFVRRLHEPAGRSMMQAIVNMAHALGLNTVAEGVEE